MLVIAAGDLDFVTEVWTNNVNQFYHDGIASGDIILVEVDFHLKKDELSSIWKKNVQVYQIIWLFMTVQWLLEEPILFKRVG